MTDIFEEIFLRVKEATGIKRQKELADLLDIREASISEAKRRGGFPPEWIVKLSTERDLNPAWLLTGQGQMKIGGAVSTPAEIGAPSMSSKAAEAMAISKYVMESETNYANALWHNLVSFKDAVEREKEVGEMKEMLEKVLKELAEVKKAVAFPGEQDKKRDSAANA